VLAHPGADLAFEVLDLRVERADHRNVGEHELAAGGELEVAGHAAWGASELGHQSGRVLPARVPLPHQECLHACDAEAVGICGAGVLLEEREEDLGVHVREQPQRSGPEPLKL
jgi:hypothetical protein